MSLSGSDEPSEPMTASATVRAIPEGLTLAIDIRTPSGRSGKTVEASDCQVLAEVTALMVATALEPAHVAGQLPPSDPPALPPAVPSLPEPTPQTIERPPGPTPRTSEVSLDDPAPTTRPPPSRVRGLLGASFALGRGIVPAFDGRIAVAAGLETPHLRAEVAAHHVFAQRIRYPDLPTVGASVVAWGGSARLGPRWEREALSLHVLADLGVAAVSAEGFGVDRPTRATDAWVALGLVPGIRWLPSSRIGLGLDLEAQVAVRRPAFVLDVLPALYRTSRIAARGSVVVEFHFGHSKV